MQAPCSGALAFFVEMELSVPVCFDVFFFFLGVYVSNMGSALELDAYGVVFLNSTHLRCCCVLERCCYVLGIGALSSSAAATFGAVGLVFSFCSCLLRVSDFATRYGLASGTCLSLFCTVGSAFLACFLV
ncbi:hypothetical protein U1Q18_032184 [Sarracenia purpurea var. burkii]